MPSTCPVCSKKCYTNSQNVLECTKCKQWIHHGNRLECSGLTDAEYLEHVNDEHKPYQCDHCTNEIIAKSNNSIFSILPFPIECEDNPFGKPITKPKPDISSMTPAQLKKFVDECENLEKQIKSNDVDDFGNNDLSTSSVNSNYYNLKKFNLLKPDISSSFGFLHVNIASLNAHIDDLRTVLGRLKFNFDIIGITEHKIGKDSSPSNNIEITGYYPFDFEPTSTTHGGAGFYIKNCHHYKPRKDLNLNMPGDVEAIFIEIIIPDRKNLIVGCVYRHPSSSISVSDFTSTYLDPILYKVDQEKKDCALLGDFNIDLIKLSNNNSASQFYNNLTSHFFTPFVLQPTRLKSKTLIDNIYLNSLEYQSKSGNLLYELSDHLLQFLILEGFAKKSTISYNNIFKRDMKNFSDREFEEIVINGTNWDDICAGGLNSFYDKILFHLDEMAPLKKVTLKEQRLMLKPWISRDILDKCDKRDSILNDMRKEMDPLKKADLMKEYKILRNRVSEEKRQGKKNHNTLQFEKNKNKSKNIWKGIRSLVNIKTPRTSSIKLMDENDNLVSDPLQIANIFNNHYSTIGQKVQQKIPNQPGDHRSYLKKLRSDGKLCINPDGSSFFLSPTVPDEVEKIIDALDTSKSSGPNGIPVILLKTFKKFFSFWLSKLVNDSFNRGEFPDLLKTAKVIPLYKKDDKLHHLNYRPISLLSVFSKIYEKLIYSRIYSYLVKYNLIYSKQFGFRGGYSTNHAIVSITEHIRNLLDQGEYVCGVFVDLEKAFDTVHHDILCDKLKFYGLRGKINDLLKSYLTNRKQFVTINGSDSEVKNITCGVPQGSSLGPLLFLLYINDFRLCLQKTSCGHFADDTFIIFNSKKLKTIETVINTELKQVIKWLGLNKLSLNAAKTELIFFHSKRRPINYDSISIKFNGIKLSPVDHVKYLGMYLDSYLSWEYHIHELSKKLSRANGILSKLRYNAPFPVCLQVYYAIFYSHLIYGCNIWGLTTDENIEKIEILQKKCIRILTFSPFNSHTSDLFKDLKILKVRDIIKMHQLKLAFDFFRNSLPDDLMSLFTLASDIHPNLTLNSTENHLLYIPKIYTTTYGNMSLRYHCAKLWNEFFKKGSIQVKDENEMNSHIHLSKMKSKLNFNNALKRHFFHQYSADDDSIYFRFK